MHDAAIQETNEMQSEHLERRLATCLRRAAEAARRVAMCKDQQKISHWEKVERDWLDLAESTRLLLGSGQAL